jgi:hypothetical protein
MRTTLIALVISTCSTAALADSCTATATAKKLAGAAKTSFMTKCTKDAQSNCDAAATAKKLYGAAKTSFTTKCVNDAVGS